MKQLRRLILAFALLAGLVPAFAQVPAPVPALPDTERRTSYSISGTNCSCNVNFALYGDGTDFSNWVEVFLNGVRVNFNDATLGWTITVPTQTLATRSRPISDAILTFNGVQTGTVQIVGARRPRRTTQFNEGTGVPTRSFNQVLTDIISSQREIWDKTNDFTGRAILGLPGESIGPMPAAATRANKFFTFDLNGNPTVASPTIGLGNVVGPVSSVNNHVAVFSGTTGTVLADGGSIGSTTLTGDVTGSGTVTFATTLATVNGNVGSFGSATQCLSITVNAKGLITAASVNTCAPSFASVTGQATLAQFPNIANNTILANNSGGSAVPSAIGPSPIFDMIGSTQGQIIYRDAGAWQVLAPGGSGQLLQSGGAAANPSWVTASGTGTVTSVANDGSIKSSIASNGAITASGTLGLWGGPGDITNCTLAGTVSGGALTVSLKGQNGSNPSASNPCIIAFRNATAATGDYTYVQATAATSFATDVSGSTFGASNSTAFRLWITAWNNAGTVVLGVSKQSTGTQIFPLNEGAVQSSTACNACNNATAAGIFYTTAAQTSKAIRILGYMDWGSGLATAGTFASGPTTIQLMGPGIKKPGDVVAEKYVISTTQTSTTATTTPGTATAASVTYTPTAAANPLRILSMGTLSNNGANSTLAQIWRSSGSVAVGTVMTANASAVVFAPAAMRAWDIPNTTSAIDYTVYIYVGAGTGFYPQTGGGRNVDLSVQEIMG